MSLLLWNPRRRLHDRPSRRRLGGMLRTESGSLPMALLIAIIVGGAVVVLFSTVRSGVSSSGENRDFSQAINAADAGIQQAVATLNASLVEEVDPCTGEPLPDGESFPVSGTCEGTLPNGSVYEWDFERLSGGGWRVLSIGHYQSAERAIEILITQSPIIDLAIVTRTRFTWPGGGNTVIDPPISIGTFHGATLPNSQSARDAIEYILMLDESCDPYDYDLSDPDKALCPDDDQDIPNIDEDRATDLCDGASDVSLADILNDDGEIKRGVWCLGRVQFNGDLPVEPAAEGNDGPAVINLRGAQGNQPAVRVRTNTDLNFEPSVSGDPVPDDLVINVAQGAGDLVISPNTAVAARIWAPWSTCVTNGQPVNSAFWGSITCDIVELRGNFRYEASEDEFEDVEPRLSAWIERPVPRSIAGN